MPIVKMDRITVVGMQQDKAAVVEALMKLGALHVDEAAALPGQDAASVCDVAAAAPAETIAVGNRQLTVNEVLPLMARLERVITESNRLRPVKKSLFASKRSVNITDFNQVVSKQSDILARLAAFEAASTRVGEIEGQLLRLHNTETMLLPWESLSLDLSALNTEHTRSFLGSFHNRAELTALEEALADEAPETIVNVLTETKTGIQLHVITLKLRESLVQSHLRRLNFSFLPVQTETATPRVLLQRLQAEQAALRQEQERKHGEMAEIAGNLVAFEILHDHLQMLVEKHNVLCRLADTEQTFILKGWTPQNLTKPIKEGLTRQFTVAYGSRPAADDEDFPILLQNNKLVRPYETVVEMFNPPLPQEVDPTPVLAPFYFIFFGLMLSDVGYGLMLTLGCLFGIYKLKLTGRTRQTAIMFLQCGISSIFWGVMFGGYFGDMIAVVTSGRVVIPPVILDPLTQPTELMLLSAIFGVLHLFSGMAVKAYMAWRDGDWQTAVFDVFAWYILIIGLALTIAGIGKPFTGYLAIAGAATIVLFSARDSRNPIARVGAGLYNLYGITGYFGDILSYSRVLALILATGVIAMVVNKIGFLGGPSFAGYITFILVGIVGHAVNFALSLLSAYIHTSRLQFVEFFGKFYEGGGILWKPEKLTSRYVEIEREQPLPALKALDS